MMIYSTRREKFITLLGGTMALSRAGGVAETRSKKARMFDERSFERSVSHLIRRR
jgi:hypothetical protein